jgi:transposase
MPTAVAKKLGIDLSSRREGELFKWFLACLLFGKPIQQEIAERAYTRLVAAGLRNADKVLDAGWDELVRLLDEAHYVRYDFSTATKLLEVCQELKQRYGSVTKLMAQTKRSSELSARLQEIKHIGPVTARIFTREVAPTWYGSRKSLPRVAEQKLQMRKTGAQ